MTLSLPRTQSPQVQTIHRIYLTENAKFLIKLIEISSVYLHSRLVHVAKIERLDRYRATLHRLTRDLTLEPLGDLPETIVIKEQKDGWEEQFQHEIEVYKRLMDLQGTVIPQFFGTGYLDGIPALFLQEINGITLHDLAHTKKHINEETLRPPLEKALRALTERGAVYWDSKLDNFMFCEDGAVVIIDLEEVTFPTKPQPYETRINSANVSSLMADFRDARNRFRAGLSQMWRV